MTKADLLKYIDERLTQRSDGNIGLLMVRQYVADNMEDYHTQNLKAYAHDFDCTIEEAEEALRKEQPSQKNESNTLEALDCVSRQAAIDVLEERLQANGYSNVALVSELNRSIGYLMRLPSAQPEIVRCKDCYLRYTSCPMVVRYGNALTFFTGDEDFCSYGKGEEE